LSSITDTNPNIIRKNIENFDDVNQNDKKSLKRQDSATSTKQRAEERQLS
jgi:hypothetical protein